MGAAAISELADIVDTRQRHYRAGQSSLHLSLRVSWAEVIGEEWKRQLRAGSMSRDLLFFKLGDRSRAQFRRDLVAIEKIGTRNASPSSLPGFNRLVSFAEALGVSGAMISPCPPDLRRAA